MKPLRILGIVLVTALFCFTHAGAWAAAQAAKPMASNNCLKCHGNFAKMENILAGNLSSKSMKAKSIQMKINQDLELVKFTPETKVKNIPDMEALKGTPAMRVHYKQVGKDKVATEIVVKPKIKVPDDQLMQVEELVDLVAKGPENGGYTLFDSRPPTGYSKGHIPTAVSLPFAKMTEMEDKLPKDKNRLIIFYCEGFR